MRRFQYKRGPFEGTSFATRFGQMGAAGPSSGKLFASTGQVLVARDNRVAHDKLIAENLSGGYVACLKQSKASSTVSPERFFREPDEVLTDCYSPVEVER